MVISEYIDSVEREPIWIYSPPKSKFNGRIMVFEIDKECNIWEIVYNSTSYRGTFEEIFNQCKIIKEQSQIERKGLVEWIRNSSLGRHIFSKS